MPDAPPRYMSLPEEFVILSHLKYGKVHNVHQTAIGCAAAELGELALRRKLTVRGKGKKLALGVVYQGRSRIHLLDTSHTGLVWADELLVELERCSASEHDPVDLLRWLRRPSQTALLWHREALIKRGLLQYKTRGLFGSGRHYPDSVVRDALINDARAAYAGRTLDEHMLFLCDLLVGAELTKDLGLTMSLREGFGRMRGTGATASFPEDLRGTSTALGMYVPSRLG